MWDAATGQPTGPTLLHGAAISSILFSPDGRSFMTLGSDKRCGCGTRPPARRSADLMRRVAVASVDFSPDGRLLLTGGMDGVARLWDVATGKPTGTVFRHDERDHLRRNSRPTAG